MFLFLIFILVFMYLINYDEYNITEDAVRFRVIANSNSVLDIAMKEKVVNKLSKLLFKNYQSEEELNKNIYDNLDNISKEIDILFKNNNYDMNYNILYGINDFPKKDFMGKHYDAGNYKSLVIEIGEAKGNNYFCILYPSLCVIDYENNSDNSKFGLKIVDIIDKIF